MREAKKRVRLCRPDRRASSEEKKSPSRFGQQPKGSLDCTGALQYFAQEILGARILRIVEQIARMALLADDLPERKPFCQNVQTAFL